ncbi:MAG: DNA polymerase III subunit delta' C-terminal domain-containing protein, partial [Bacteroidota bacterium]|nr:DNA polymerase III subunit delta' C-terminal domain-containing protein [Bacteroidota bacterium]
SRRELLPRTILSRCQQLFCPPLPDTELTAALRQRHQLSETEARIVAAFAQGSYAQALLFLEHDIQAFRQHALELFRTALKPTRFRQELLHQIEELFGTYNRTRAELVLELLQLWLRDAFVLTYSHNPELLLNADQYATLHRFLQRFPQADLPAMLLALDSATRLVHRYVNIPLLVLTTLLRCRLAANPLSHPEDTDVLPTAA